MQKTPIAPAAPAAPDAPGSPPAAQAPASGPSTLQPTTYRDMVPGTPLSERQREQLDAVRETLSSQLISVSDRRDEAAQALRNATGADREGLEQRLRQLDARILQLEADIEHTGRLITSPPFLGEPGMFVPPPNFGPPDRGPDMTAISIVFTLFVLAPMALAAARLMWKRATGQRAPAPSFESIQRLERVEHALDSIAVEVERISEGQRFVTRILTEGSAQSVLKAGQQGDSLGAARREGVKVARDGQQ